MMSEGQIPVRIGDLPVSSDPLDESQVYSAAFKKATLAQKLAKNGAAFCGMQFEVISGDFEGATLMINYLPIPVAILPDDGKAARFQKSRNNEMFGRFAKA